MKLIDCPVVPLGFDLAKADDNTFSRYGLPTTLRDVPVLRERWAPIFQDVPFGKPKLGPTRPRNTAIRRRRYGLDSTNWAGAVMPAPAGQELTWVTGSWSVPSAMAPASAQNGLNYVVAAWVGLDGAQSTGDLLQAGCTSTVTLHEGTPKSSTFAWIEWVPAGSHPLDDFVVNSGDQLDCHVQFNPDGTATIIIVNKTVGCGHSYPLDAESAAFAGSCAEWIVEANGDLGPLARFDPLVFSACVAGNGNVTVTPGEGATRTMINGFGQSIATGTIIGANQVRVTNA